MSSDGVDVCASWMPAQLVLTPSIH